MPENRITLRQQRVYASAMQSGNVPNAGAARMALSELRDRRFPDATDMPNCTKIEVTNHV